MDGKPSQLFAKAAVHIQHATMVECWVTQMHVYFHISGDAIIFGENLKVLIVFTKVLMYF